MKHIITLALTVIYTVSLGTTVNYTVHIPQPHTHYLEIEAIITNNTSATLTMKMPVWAPGSYLVREFARHVEAVTATINGITVIVKKTNKNTWQVPTNGAKEIKFSYKVYANELSVRTSCVNTDHAYINGTSVFMFIDKQQNIPYQVTIDKPTNWSTISTSLPLKSGTTYQATNYDQLVDCPIEIGNHTTFEFTASGTQHRVALYGTGNYSIDSLKKDMANITTAATNVIGENPNKIYDFIIHNVTIPSGGLEHMAATTLEVNRFTYAPGASYKQFLALVAHEYFHLWNVKRIRPIALGPFDYENENYTNLLWVSEGFTSYYEERIVHRAGYETNTEYLDYLAGTIAGVENQPGARVQSANNASFDAWIKQYRPHENSNNTTISYYGKGEIIAAALDLLIINNTNATKSLDDVMRLLYNEYYKKQNRGFTDDEFKQAVASIANTNVDAFFNNYVIGTERIDFKTYLGYAGLDFKTKPNTTTAYLGASLVDVGGKLMVKNVMRGTSAYEGGVNTDDEIIAIDNYRVNQDKFTKYIAAKKLNDEVTLTLSRDDIVRTIVVTLKGNPSLTYSIGALSEQTDKQKQVRKKWLGTE
ncbi:MAG: M61 family metallopeptidase [Bacteroidia bacterium]|nr:M61 family metallopeptidase [Bacteroidia bacterium]